ncbi:fructose 1,6-bisphosphatase [Microbacterium sp. SSW1-59]|uniref:fructose 1,6-bisphosphatase n=1 Tax=Microbacterium xanthum TaxID=3079794 RepID=UPI002AD4D84F|nr:fructose 1,6-bisphosphatase [Microbacterium sp. SSW1-59]MDZ8201156.1 fructose 1,6-bisphosphatase [Microbacterium sp. SSW1-59]
MSTSSSPITRRVVAVGAAFGLAVSLAGCTQVAEIFNGVQQPAAADEPVAYASPTPLATEDIAFDSLFAYDGSVALSTDVADQLELRLDVWAADPKRTSEWDTSTAKTFGFAVNVYDHYVDEKAVLTQKRRVYISSISITSQTAQTSGQVQNPFQFSSDPRTLVPSDTLRSDRGLLLNSFQGGLLVPETTINQLPADTYGVTLEFAMTIAVEGVADDDDSFSQQTVYQYLPIAISSDEAAEQ